MRAGGRLWGGGGNPLGLAGQADECARSWPRVPSALFGAATATALQFSRNPTGAAFAERIRPAAVRAGPRGQAASCRRREGAGVWWWRSRLGGAREAILARASTAPRPCCTLVSSASWAPRRARALTPPAHNPQVSRLGLGELGVRCVRAYMCECVCMCVERKARVETPCFLF